ncbi:MAG: replicative DNA helicase [Thermoguttaceae bacterium]|nr:replicative DNA helicase [Thermoguttaceae bacterium]
MAKKRETGDAARVLPNNLEAERGVLGAILLDPQLCDDVSLVVRPDDFYLDKHRRIYRRLLAMNAESTGVDVTLLVEALRSSGELEEIGGEAYLAELMTSVQVTAHASHYAKIVAQNSMRRMVIGVCETALNDAYSPEIQPKELVARTEERIFEINDKHNTTRIERMSDLLPEVFHLIDARAAGEVDGVPTGFKDLDKMIGGLHGSELIILAARPSMGKTALATNIADYVAVEKHEPTIFFSLEMARTELALRMLCARGRIPGEHLRGSLTSKEQASFSRAASALSEAPLYIDDSPSRTVTEIGAVARRLKRHDGLALIIIDYLGLIEPDNPSDPRQEQVAKIARRLKGLARELNVPVLCLAQLNRQTEMTKDNRPRLSHLRESGAIEQDADVVMFVHREEYYHSKEDAEEKGLRGLADIIVAKQRNGPVGDVRLAWVSRYTLFGNLKEGLDETELMEEYENDFSQFGGEGTEIQIQSDDVF